MNINRNNYEEYFLLYADKELSTEEKKRVEMFVKQNADLEEEFIMLQQSVVKPDNTIRLTDKNFLFKNEGFIDETNYKEKFLLYVDNELSLSEIEDTEKFVLTNPSLLNEFALLQQVRYEADTSIVFPDKISLYKKEDDTKVIPFRWKALAAAVLLGIALWTGVNYLQSNKAEKIVATKQTKIPTEKIPVKPVEQKDDVKYLVKEDDQKIQLPKHVQNNFDNPVKKQIQPQQNVTVKNVQPINKPEVKVVDQKKEDVVIDLPNKNEVNKTNDLPQPVNIIEPNYKTVTTIPALQNNYIQPASYIADAEVKSENYVFYNITTEEFKKSKVGNFLKKVKRAIERKIPFKNNSFKAEVAKNIEN